MPRLITVTIALIVSAGTAHALETDRVVEAFSCTYNDGQGPDELHGVIEFLNAQIDRIGDASLSGYGAGLLTPLRATLDADFIWIGGHRDLNTMARALTALEADAGGRQTTARFAEVADCDANLFFTTPVYIGSEPDDEGGTAVIEIDGCTLNADQSLADAEAAETGFASVAGALGAGVNVFRWVPYLASTPYDLVYLAVHRDLTSFASFNTTLLTTAAGRQSTTRFSAVMDCESGLFRGQLARRAAPG